MNSTAARAAPASSKIAQSLRPDQARQLALHETPKPGVSRMTGYGGPGPEDDVVRSRAFDGGYAESNAFYVHRIDDLSNFHPLLQIYRLDVSGIRQWYEFNGDTISL